MVKHSTLVDVRHALGSTVPAKRSPTVAPALDGRDDWSVRTPVAIVELPLPLRFAATGGLALGALGCVTGLVIGLRVYAPTAWAATFEIGIPSALLGAVLGLAAGSVRLLVLRPNHSPKR
jgi:hypothetical protein